ncbi:MAG: hypothetical protein DRP78_06930 [Candidatus Omnitrophota bacterium]|nr:MAG: hypothetical protein DRP78_06930 [Candidatus Omnitrophota bacterium]
MDFYQKNLSCIKEKCPELLEKLAKNSKDETRIETIYAKNGSLTVKVKQRFLHSAYNPEKEAQDLIKKQNLADNDNLLIFGFGFGYHIFEILKMRINFKTMIVIEPDVDLFKIVLRHKDLSDFLNLKNLKIYLGCSTLDIFDSLSNFGLQIVSGDNKVIEHPGSIIVNRQYFDELRPRILDTIRFVTANVHTISKFSKVIVRNLSTNFTKFIVSPGINTLFNQFKNIPAIIVSAGPSLDKNVCFLQKAKGKSLILSTDTAFKILLKHKIVPDFVFTMDFQQASKKHFTNVFIDDVPLIFDAEAASASLKAHKGRKFCSVSNNDLAVWLNNYLFNKGVVHKGMCVAHFAFSSALQMGCAPIIFVGQDLSFPGGVTHAQGTSSRQKVSSNRSKLMRISNQETGETFLTAEAMYIYLRHFETMIANTSIRCINATQGGVNIKGTEVMPLKQVIARYCTKKVMVEPLLRKITKEYAAPQLETVGQAIDNMLEKITKVKKTSAKVIRILKKIFTLSEQNNTDQKKIAKLFFSLKILLKEIQQQELLLRLMHPDILSAIIEMEKEGEIIANEKSKIDPPEIVSQFKTDLQFQKAINQSSAFYEQCLKKMLKQVKEIVAGKHCEQ